MPYQRKYDFKPGTKASSGQVNEELDQLIAAVNKIETDEKTKDTLLRSLAQLTKITNDSGGVKLSTSSTSDDILQILLNAGKGIHTFYAVGGSQNLPPTNISTRGIAHFTDNGIGWVYATDYRNNIFTNYYDAGSWKGWSPLLSPTGAQIAKITWDDGNVKLNAGETTDDILSMIKNAGIGLHTFYARSGSKNLPDSSQPIRGIAHITSATLSGYAIAITNDNRLYTNYCAAGTWLGWKIKGSEEVQSGKVTVTSTGNDVKSVNVTFPIAYASAPFVVATVVTALPGARNAGVNNITSTGFTLNIGNTSSGLDLVANWIAKGTL